jgi:hypothetical protein
MPRLWQAASFCSAGLAGMAVQSKTASAGGTTLARIQARVEVAVAEADMAPPRVLRRSVAPERLTSGASL